MPSAATLGKRKRRPAQEVEENPDAAALEAAQAIFRKHFEAQFAAIDDKPAEKTKKTSESTESEDGEGNGIEDMRSDSGSNEDDGEWGGLSGEDDSEGRQYGNRPSVLKLG